MFQLDDEQQPGQDSRVPDDAPDSPGPPGQRSREELQVGPAEIRLHQHREEHQPGHYQHLHQAGETHSALQEENHL